MPNHEGSINRDHWKNNAFGINKEDFDNVLDYMEAVEEAMLYGEDDDDDDADYNGHYYTGDDDE